MSTEVPLKIRMDIRDQWDSPESSVQKSVDALAQKLGHKVTPHIEWPALWNELKDGYPEKGTFVSTIARLTVAWYERLLWRLQSEIFLDWTEKLLSVLAAAAPTRLNIEPSSPPHTQPHTTWRTTTKSFYLGIPKVVPPSQAQFVTSLDKDFENLFASPDSGSAIEHEEGRADVTVEDTPPAPVANQAQPQPPPPPPPDENSAIRRLPVIDAIPQPTELFRNNAPYYLVVEAGGCPIRVQSSHEPSLELLAAYINKWGRTNTRDGLKRNVLKAELFDSDLCCGVTDTVMIGLQRNFSDPAIVVNPTIILAFVEGVLGYKLVHTNGHIYTYKSEIIVK